ncbi:MAG: hypothetical protein ACREFR_01000 [Limisphaerales bacterium]
MNTNRLVNVRKIGATMFALVSLFAATMAFACEREQDYSCPNIHACFLIDDTDQYEHLVGVAEGGYNWIAIGPACIYSCEGDDQPFDYGDQYQPTSSC